MKIEKWIQNNNINLKGELIAVTGATGSIGQELCNIFAKTGANLILLDRNMEKSDKLKQKLQQTYPNITVKNYRVDMSDIISVKTVCKKLQDEPITTLVLNAGAFRMPNKKTDLGYDIVFQINFISPYFMIRSLLPQLRQRTNAKIVITSSISYSFSKLDLKNVDYSNRKPIKTYANSKKFLLFSLLELFKNEKNVQFCPAHPGVSSTGIISNYPKIIRNIAKCTMNLLFMNPQKACLSIVKATHSSCYNQEWFGPRFFNVWGTPKKSKIKCKKEELEKIAQIAEDIYIKSCQF
ncbi:MAG: SDR family NAD(P)-dependent oxidoreductase [Candidatus Caccovivens sp.]